jgi:hypothetical protein
MSNSALARTSVFGLVLGIIALAFVAKLGGQTDGMVCIMSNICVNKAESFSNSTVKPKSSKEPKVSSELDYDPKLRIVK